MTVDLRNSLHVFSFGPKPVVRRGRWPRPQALQCSGDAVQVAVSERLLAMRFANLRGLSEQRRVRRACL